MNGRIETESTGTVSIRPFFLPPAFCFPGLMTPEDTMGMKLQEALTR
jgi:hypothetical protein